MACQSMRASGTVRGAGCYLQNSVTGLTGAGRSSTNYRIIHPLPLRACVREHKRRNTHDPLERGCSWGACAPAKLQHESGLPWRGSPIRHMQCPGHRVPRTHATQVMESSLFSCCAVLTGRGRCGSCSSAARPSTPSLSASPAPTHPSAPGVRTCNPVLDGSSAYLL